MMPKQFHIGRWIVRVLCILLLTLQLYLLGGWVWFFWQFLGAGPESMAPSKMAGLVTPIGIFGVLLFLLVAIGQAWMSRAEKWAYFLASLPLIIALFIFLVIASAAGLF